MIRRMCMAVALVFLCRGDSTAQTVGDPAARKPTQSFEQLRNAVAVGETLYIVDTAGTETKGRVVNVLDVALTLSVDGARRQFTAESVGRVDRRRPDPVRNGVLIGLGAGALAGFGIGRAADSPTCPRAGIECGQGAAIGIVSGALWGAVGGWITDALIRQRETLYIRR